MNGAGHPEDPGTTAETPASEEPSLIAGRYRIVRTLGKGGGGIVWLARDEKLGREVALKRVAGEADAEVLVTRGLREARTSATLAHEHVVRVYDAFEFEGSPWIVMEHVPGPSLAELTEDGQVLPPAQVALIGVQVATALAAAHQAGIIHRDVKPGNVLLSDRSGRNAKLTDFGIARAEEDAALTQTGFVAGTAAYFSPELARGEDPSPASDVWALGVTLYAAVEGHRPFPAEANAVAQLHTIAREEPTPPARAGALTAVLQGMLDTDPTRRWDAERAATELRRVSTGQDVSAPAAHHRATDHHRPADNPTQAVPVRDATRSIPHAGERRPAAWPGGPGDRGADQRHPAPPPSAHARTASPARPARRRRRPMRPSMWLGWLLVVPLLAALAWLVWTIVDGQDGSGTDPSAVTQAVDAEPVSVQEALTLADRFYVVVSREGPDGVADMLGPDAEVDPEIRDGLTQLRYEGMVADQREDGAVLVTTTVNYTYGDQTVRQDEELVIGRAEVGGEPLVLLLSTQEAQDDPGRHE